MTVDTVGTRPPRIPENPRPAEYQRLARQLLEQEQPGLEPLSVAMLASSTLDFLRPVMVVEGARRGLGIDLFLGGWGQLEELVLDPSSDLYSASPDALILAFQPSHIAPDVMDRYYASNGEELDTVCTQLVERLLGAARTFREQTGNAVLVSNFAIPPSLPLGPFDAGDPGSLTHRLAAWNLDLAERAHEEADVYVWDYAGLVRDVGTAGWADPRLELMARVAVAADGQPCLARQLLRTIQAVRRPPAKCLVLDLDNTLWGGVVGDEGIEGIRIGDDWPGNAFKAFQRTVLGVRDRGFLLAVVSKNDEAVAKQVFQEHPEMLIGWGDLAATRINWEPKSINMRAIADELNIGIDSLVLFDDNPVERAEVRASVPEAGVIDVPGDPIGYRAALESSGFFDRPGLLSEDRLRADMYRVERQRTALQAEAPSMEAFLEGLDMEAVVAEAGQETLGRIAQLVGKTNQFNLTTRRHEPAQVARLADDDGAVVAWLRIGDRFGDQGLVAVGILELRDSDCWIDTFLMSCRVMNRGVEHAMMAYLVEQARALGAKRLIGEYRPTERNHIVESLLAEMGFAPHGESDGGTLWALELDHAPPLWPDHIRRADNITSETTDS